MGWSKRAALAIGILIASGPVAPAQSSDAAEIAFWDSIRSSSVAAEFEAYLNRFPDGIFSDLARLRLQALTGTVAATEAAEPDPVAACDRLAAMSEDPDAPVLPNGVSITDMAAAIETCEAALAANPGMHRLRSNIGNLYMLLNDLDMAAQWYAEAADAGLPYAQYQLGLIEQSRLFTDPENRAVHRQLFRDAAEQGLVPAQRALGYDLLDSHRFWQGPAGNVPEGLRWLTLAAEAGDGTACRFLGFAHHAGWGAMPQDLPAARRWYAEGHALGDVLSSLGLARLLAEGRGGPQDVAEARAILEPLAQQAEERGPEATLLLAQMLELGLGTDPDPAAAAQTYRDLAEGEGPRSVASEAQFLLARLMEEGRGVPQDPAGAAALYEEMSFFGVVRHGRARLIDMLAQGIGVTQDPFMADHFLDAARGEFRDEDLSALEPILHPVAGGPAGHVPVAVQGRLDFDGTVMAVPADWQTVSAAGLRIRVPPDFRLLEEASETTPVIWGNTDPDGTRSFFAAVGLLGADDLESLRTEPSLRLIAEVPVVLSDDRVLQRVTYFKATLDAAGVPEVIYLYHTPKPVEGDLHQAAAFASFEPDGADRDAFLDRLRSTLAVESGTAPAEGVQQGASGVDPAGPEEPLSEVDLDLIE